MENQNLSKKEEYLLKKEQKEKEQTLRVRNKKIKKAMFTLLLPAFLIAVGIFVWWNAQPERNQASSISALEKPKITVFYSPTCSCCKGYIAYLKGNNFEVEARATRDMLAVKEQHQIPSGMESCHTSVIGDYFVEGHIPVEVIKKLFEEKPEIDGIALPGMPHGSPGMGGFKTAPFQIYGLLSGQPSEFLSW